MYVRAVCIIGSVDYCMYANLLCNIQQPEQELRGRVVALVLNNGTLESVDLKFFPSEILDGFVVYDGVRGLVVELVVVFVFLLPMCCL